MFATLQPDPFTIVAEPTRRRILDELATGECAVGVLVDRLGVTQPTVSKHLKVLREAGFLSARVDAQHRIYRVEAGPIRELDRWIARYRRFWTEHLDALEDLLDEEHLDDV
jgi:DNA-binding transcriptional ArsR family regulator